MRPVIGLDIPEKLTRSFSCPGSVCGPSASEQDEASEEGHGRTWMMTDFDE